MTGHLSPGTRALDLCTGNGLCTRWLAERDASVVAADGSRSMLQQVRARTDSSKYDIQFEELDVTDNVAMGKAAEAAHEFRGYDIVLMNMAIMDVPTLEPLVQALPKLLNESGVFVATILHPVFFTSNYSRNIGLNYNQITGELEVIRTKIIKAYLHVPPVKGIALPGQPAMQLYFHRSFQDLFAPFFRAGLLLGGMEEPAFTEEDHDPTKIESSKIYTQLPAILSFRMRLGAI